MSKMIKLLNEAKDLKASQESISLSSSSLNLQAAPITENVYETNQEEDVQKSKRAGWYDHPVTKLGLVIVAVLFLGASIYLNGKASLVLSRMENIQATLEKKDQELSKEVLALRNELMTLRNNELASLKTVQIAQKKADEEIKGLNAQMVQFVNSSKGLNAKNKELESTNKVLLDKYVGLNQVVKELQYQLKELRRGL